MVHVTEGWRLPLLNGGQSLWSPLVCTVALVGGTVCVCVCVCVRACVYVNILTSAMILLDQNILGSLFIVSLVCIFSRANGQFLLLGCSYS